MNCETGRIFGKIWMKTAVISLDSGMNGCYITYRTDCFRQTAGDLLQLRNGSHI